VCASRGIERGQHSLSSDFVQLARCQSVLGAALLQVVVRFLRKWMQKRGTPQFERRSSAPGCPQVGRTTQAAAANRRAAAVITVFGGWCWWCWWLAELRRSRRQLERGGDRRSARNSRRGHWRC